jgi:hypothetical protein
MRRSASVMAASRPDSTGTGHGPENALPALHRPPKFLASYWASLLILSIRTSLLQAIHQPTETRSLDYSILAGHMGPHRREAG